MKQEVRDERALYTNTAGVMHGSAAANMYITSCTGLQVSVMQETAAKENAGCCMMPLSSASRSSVLDYLGLRSFEMSFCQHGVHFKELNPQVQVNFPLYLVLYQ
jgi:hypothetical protein